MPNISDNFPIKNMTKIIGRPNYESITILRNELVDNAISVPCTLGGGAHGYIGLVNTPARYLIIAGLNNTLIAPNYPGALPVIPVTVPVQTEAQRDVIV